MLLLPLKVEHERGEPLQHKSIAHENLKHVYVSAKTHQLALKEELVPACFREG